MPSAVLLVVFYVIFIIIFLRENGERGIKKQEDLAARFFISSSLAAAVRVYNISISRGLWVLLVLIDFQHASLSLSVVKEEDGRRK